MTWMAFLTEGDHLAAPAGPPGPAAAGELAEGATHDIQLIGKGKALRVVRIDGDEAPDQVAARLAPGTVTLRCVLDRHHLDEG